jgi:hypothetical protein
MGKWLHKALKPTDTAESGPHADMETLACLIEGKLGGDERKKLLHHLNRCGQCYEILQETLKDFNAELSDTPNPIPWWKTRPTLALAASMALLVLIGGPLVYQFQTRQSLITSVELVLDQELKDIMLEDDNLQWTNDKRIHRFISVLNKKGYHVKLFDRVVLSKPYYQVKSIFGPEEVLHIRIDDDVAYLEIKETQ